MDHVEFFCEKLVILVKGKTVLEGYLKDIKNEFKMKKVIISGDVNKKDLEKIKGVISVNKIKDEYCVNIKDSSVNKEIFSYIKKKNNITKYLTKEPSLEEIFVAKVGEAYGK